MAQHMHSLQKVPDVVPGIRRELESSLPETLEAAGDKQY